MATSIQKLYLFQVATMTIPPLTVPAVCYLVQTDDGKNILIDSGIPENIKRTPSGSVPTLGKSVVEQLALLGLRPEDIHLLVCTHFDVDHAGNHAAFPNAELVVQKKHYEHALPSQHPRFALTRAQWTYPGARARFVEGDVELVPGLELIATDGHCLGHQSVLIRLPESGPILLAIDAVASANSFTPEHQASPVDEDEEQLKASTRKLLAIAQREQVQLVVFGHDLSQWQELKKAPEYYS